MDALLALLLVVIGFAAFVFLVNRSVKFIVLGALAIAVIAAAVYFGGVTT